MFYLAKSDVKPKAIALKAVAPWRMRVWALAALTAASLPGGCRLTPGQPFSTVISQGPVTIRFLGHAYEARYVAAPTEVGRFPDVLVITIDQLSPIGPADEADVHRFSDGIVYVIQGVDPQDAVAMIDRNDPNEAKVVAFTRDSRPPETIHGLCSYYSDASTRRCP